MASLWCANSEFLLACTDNKRTVWIWCSVSNFDIFIYTTMSRDLRVNVYFRIMEDISLSGFVCAQLHLSSADT